MKMLEIKTDGEMHRFSLDSVRSHIILQIPRIRKDPAHHVMRVTLTPYKRLDGEARGQVIDHFQEYEFRFDSFEDAQSATAVVDV
ncbi:MAG: hypothetical protein Q8O23_00050 [Gallionella sp.]|nr:hypothetical protein [Gallionella sp.]